MRKKRRGFLKKTKAVRIKPVNKHAQSLAAYGHRLRVERSGKVYDRKKTSKDDDEP